MQIWIWAFLMMFLWTFLVAWLLIRHFLTGPSLRIYDDPPLDRHAGSRDRASPEHQEAVRLLERNSAEIRSVPKKQWLETVRRVMARGFCQPPLHGAGVLPAAAAGG